MDKRRGIVHIDGTFLSQNVASVSRFIVEGDICTDALHECYLFIGAGRSNHFEAIRLGELDDRSDES